MLRCTVRMIAVFAVAVPLLLATACGGGDSDSDSDSNDSNGSNGASGNNGSSNGSSSGDSTANPTSTPGGAPANTTNASVTLEAEGGSAVEGSVELTQAGGLIQYSVSASGASEGMHALYIFLDGDGCGGASRIGPLTPLDTAADGNGTSEGSFIGQLSDVVGSFFAVFEGDNTGTELIACGRLEASP